MHTVEEGVEHGDCVKHIQGLECKTQDKSTEIRDLVPNAKQKHQNITNRGGL